MPAADPIERQIRQVRRRRNLHELQRGLFLLVATAAASAAGLVLLALRAGERLFAVATWSLVGAVAVTGAFFAHEVTRRWIARDRAAAWIDARARLGGRLTTLVAVRARDAALRADAAPGARHDDDAHAFLPLLVDENVVRLECWRPRHLVRRPVPLAALAAALTATAALLFALWIAPRLRPSLPEILYSDQPVEEAEAGDAAADGVPDRIVVAPTRAEAARRHGHDAETRVGGSGEGEDDSRLARLSSGLQNEIRRQLWGREWERARDAMARATRDAARGAAGGRASVAGSGAADDEDAADDDERWETAAAPATRNGGRRSSAFGRAGHARSTEASDEEAAARGFGDDADTTVVGTGNGVPAPGAGNETDPNLFGAATDVDPHGTDTFELAIDAPERAQRGGSRHAHGEPPPAGTDTHPELARGGRPEHAIRRMPVPQAYEAIVREVFAHRDATAGTPR